ncbi:MAG: phage major capsid protein [Rubripirellula sp.]|nr:phage major capsid protein [Rubripirellula sp.]
MSIVEVKSDLAPTPRTMFEEGRPTRKHPHLTDEQLFEAGMVLQAYGRNDEAGDVAKTWCKANGEFRNEHNWDWAISPTTNAAFIAQRENFGSFERNTRVVPVENTVVTFPRIYSSTTGYWVGSDEAEITESDMTFDAVTGHLRKLGVLTRFSSELDADSVADAGAIVLADVAAEFARMIDEAAFNGTGTSAYGGVTGLAAALNASATKTASTATIADLTAADWEGCHALLEDFDDEPVWYMNRSTYVNSCLQDHSTWCEVDNGQRYFMGHRVEFVPVIPSSGNSTFVAFLGSLKLSTTMFTHGPIRIVRSDERFMESDEVGIRCTQRMTIVVHERGDATRRRSICGLKTAA